MSLDVDRKGFEGMKIMLEKLQGIPEIADRELKQIANEIQKTARNMSPIEYGDLKAAIVVRRRGGGRNAKGQFVKGQSSYEISINNNHPSKTSGTVGAYVWKVHEYMGWGGHHNVLMPSKRSVTAGASRGEEAGGKFMDRAFARYQPLVRNRLSRVIEKYKDQIRQK